MLGFWPLGGASLGGLPDAAAAAGAVSFGGHFAEIKRKKRRDVGDLERDIRLVMGREPGRVLLPDGRVIVAPDLDDEELLLVLL